MKTIIVMPAYNAERTLLRTYQEIPSHLINKIILCDDRSSDRTIEVANSLGIEVLTHEKNLGYGANQKTLYKKALSEGADIIVMLHPDYQYDPKKIPNLIQSIKEGYVDCVLGSRILGGKAREGGMPLYKYISNRFLTFCENMVLRQSLSEYHTGLRAFSKKALENIPWYLNGNGFIFDTQILLQLVNFGFRISEIPIDTRYFPEASEVGFLGGLDYGVKTLLELLKHTLNKVGFIKIKRYRKIYSPSP